MLQFFIGEFLKFNSHFYYKVRCQTIRIVIDFANFKINNVTYNPKYESLELLSVIGGYMGIYLGISLLAIYDFAEILVRKLYSTLKRRQKRRNKVKDVNHSQISSRCHTKLVRIVRQRHQSGVFRKRPAKIHPHRRRQKQDYFPKTIICAKIFPEDLVKRISDSTRPSRDDRNKLDVTKSQNTSQK
ncbi:hypothetical protein JTE90_012338 [Oedothorax gibbosus]|uniref:Uncharacterized protein n=1 Tax=Oedothorax gibbosus TaxID=931172 RepID=A0AAV6VKU7_9ARAC|nr:hypothetical protein JTE90_012338 [Oedothorax gibbosus]